MNFFLFFTTNFLVFYICRFFSCFAYKEKKLDKRIIASLGSVPVLVFFILISLSAFRAVNAVNVCLIVLVLSAVLYFLNKGKFRNVSADNILNIKFNSIPCSVVCGVFITFLILYTAKSCLLGTCFIFDDYSYHAPVCAHWLKDGYFSLKPLNYHAYYPFNGELISFWLMLPFGNDSVVFLAGLFWMLFLLIISACFISSAGTGNKTKMFGLIALILLSNVIYKSAKSFSAVDLACPVMTLAAVYMISGNKDNRNRFDYLFSGLFLGFAIGAKISFLPVGLIFFITILIDKTIPFKQRLINLIIFIFSMMVTGSFWYIRNFVITGNPLYPAEFLFFKGAFSADYLNKTKLIYRLTSTNLNLSDYLSVIKSHLNWPYSLGVVSVLGCFSYPFINKKNRLYTMLFFTCLIFMAFYLFTPFSGTVHYEGAPLRIDNRFLILPFAAGIILAGLWIRKDIVVLIMLVFLIFVDRKILLGKNLFAGLTLISVTSVCIYLFREKFENVVRLIFRFKWIIYALFLLFIFLLIPHNRQLTSATIKNYGHENQPIGKGWNKLNELHEDSIVTCFGDFTYQYYPIFGRSFQLVPISVSEDGSEYLPLHKCGAVINNTSNLIMNLKRQHINYVFISRETNKSWPAQYTVLSVSDEVEEIYNDSCSAIFQLKYK